VNTSPASESNGGAVYVPQLNRYLLVYESPIATDQTIWGQFLLPSGAPTGGPFQIDGPTFGGGNPKVAWSPQSNEFLVTWMSCCSYSNFARRISASGAPVSEPFTITGNLLGIGNWNPFPIWNA